MTYTKSARGNILSRLPDHSWPVKAIIATPESNRIGLGTIYSRYHIRHYNPDINNNSDSNKSNNNRNEPHTNHSVLATKNINPADHHASSSSLSSPAGSNRWKENDDKS